MADASGSALGQALHSFPKLTKAAIMLNNTKLSDAGGQALASGLDRPLLLDLDLRLRASGVADNTGVALGRSLSKCSNMLKLRLELEDTQMGDATGVALGKALRECPKIAEAAISLFRTKLTDKGGPALVAGLNRPELQDLDLRLFDTAVGDGTAEALGRSVSVLSKLTKAKISLYNTKLTDRGGAALATGLNRPELKDIDLSFQDTLVADSTAAALG
eukprot:CAMPEP_0204312732 /NCGR_PEP_ID=MMETSP0469-20131031/3154_1 /ASSEMBLY_ACC=CAM_ASM_000384 /TAXON_ID=2969 /ORGANISM="Oxyrrhis marina" /LENGTH=217 /DNA_ID=CAMNT_0051292903 /DNA_START=20 /DNA_END=669 /DNA_ORIENTATION=+